MKRLIKNIFYWAFDYVYVAKEQTVGFFSMSPPDQYKNKGGPTIILIPGVYENWRFMRPIAKVLSVHGYDVHVIEGLGYNRGTIEQMADVVKIYITEKKLANLIIIAHSKGGLIGKYLLSTYMDPTVIRGLIAINTPFSGSYYAYLLPIKSLRIFIPNSKVLSSLAANKIINTHIVSIYGLFDPHIPGGSRLEGGRNIQLDTYGHFRILKNPTVHEVILENIHKL